MTFLVVGCFLWVGSIQFERKEILFLIKWIEIVLNHPWYARHELFHYGESKMLLLCCKWNIVIKHCGTGKYTSCVVFIVFLCCCFLLFLLLFLLFRINGRKVHLDKNNFLCCYFSFLKVLSWKLLDHNYIRSFLSTIMRHIDNII